MDASASLRGPLLQGLPGVQVGTRRAICEDCGAHAAVVMSGASVTGSCSVCGSGKLQVMETHLPPPRRWAR
jgi:hypothetical protein